MSEHFILEVFWTLGVVIGTVVVITVLYEAWLKINRRS